MKKHFPKPVDKTKIATYFESHIQTDKVDTLIDVFAVPANLERNKKYLCIVSDLWTTRYSEMKSILLPIPPRSEQDQIVRFLDWKVSKINSLINIKKKKIYEYEEWKHSEIYYIVTCGVSKEIAKKRTAEAWVPEIPEHWDMRRIKFLFDMRDERNYQPLSDVNLISLYTRLGVVQNKDVEYTTGNRARNADGYKIVHKNDIIVNIILCWMGAIGMSNYNGVTSPAYDIYIPKEGVHSRYYHYLFRTKALVTCSPPRTPLSSSVISSRDWVTIDPPKGPNLQMKNRA